MAAVSQRYNPGWDAEVVPALRKRLESESRTLTHRLSIIEDQNQNQGEMIPIKSKHKEQLGNRNDPQPTYSPRPAVSPPSRIPAPRKSGTYNHPNGSVPVLPVQSPSLHQQPSQSSIIIPPASTKPILVHEPVPFLPSQSSGRASMDSQVSTTSSQHPFEHWYRGDTSRNGGVGELKVGKRQEMLDIANYGHTLARRKEREAEIAEGKRRRAGSVTALDRSSFYMDEVEEFDFGTLGGRVQDERPLSDADHNDDYYDDEADPNYVNPDYYDEDSIAIGFPPSSSDATSPNSTVTPTHTSSHRFPPRGASEPPFRPDTSTTTTTSPASARTVTTKSRARATSNPRNPQNASINGRQASPSPGSVNHRDPRKNNRLAASQATRQRVESTRKMEKENQDRRSIAAYDLDPNITPESIPQMSYSQQHSGQWDDVVLPVVAKKKGFPPGVSDDGRMSPSQHPFTPNNTLQRPPTTTNNDDEPEVMLIGSSLHRRHADGNYYEMDEFGGSRGGPKNPHDSVLIPTLQNGVMPRKQVNSQPASHQGATVTPYMGHDPASPTRVSGLQNGNAMTMTNGGQDMEKDEMEKKGGCGCCVVM